MWHKARVWVTSRPVTCWTWSLFTAATRWLQWLHLHIHLIIEVDAQISVKLTHTPLVGGGLARRCFAHSVAGQLQKISTCKLYGMYALYSQKFTGVMIKSAYMYSLTSINLNGALMSLLQIPVL